MEIELLAIILAVLTQVFANRNETTSDRINSTAENNNTALPRQAGYGLIKFEEQASTIKVDDLGDPNSHGLVTFEDQPSNRPFRFKYDHKEFNKQPIDSLEFAGQNVEFNQDVENQRYDIYKPKRFGNQSPDVGLNNPEDHPVFGSPDPTNNINNPEGQSGYGLVFQDDNRIEGNNSANAGQKKRKRRRRRRKPKQLAGPGYGFAPSGVGGPELGVPSMPGSAYPTPFATGQPYRPGRRRPRPSIAEGALASITSALTSIARYDDLQCVPRLLCEVAGGQNPVTGTGGAPGSGILQTIVNLQPLVTLLAAYNGVSTSPLFVFGRAALLGMTSKGNAGSCRYAYSQCPTDPQKLVEYLNNHNGGFFRFFNNPQPYGQQNLEQFYSQLSGDYGYPPQGNLGVNGFPNQNFGGYPDANLGGGSNANTYQQMAGQYPELNGPEGLVYPAQNQGYGFPNPGQVSGQQIPGFQNHVPGQNYGTYEYHGSQQNYGFGYPYQQRQFKSTTDDVIEKNRIEKRIQNRPDVTYVGGGPAFEDDGNTKWTFPDNKRNKVVQNKQRFGRTVVFPEKDSSQFDKEPNAETTLVQQNIDANKKAKGFNFPENQSNRQYIDYYNYPPCTRIIDNNNFKLTKQGFYVESNEEYDYNNQENKGYKENEDGVELVYVLRGDGDPAMPEIIKLRPGQKVQ